MFAIKKFVPLLALLALSCGKHDFDNSVLSSVTFFNNSSYYANIHSTSFSGPVLIDKLASGMSYSTTVSPSSNYGSGSVFSIEYWYLVANYAECSCGDVWTGGIDPDVQISRNIEAGMNYVIQIPQPKNLKLDSAFFKILNTSGKHFELNYLGTYFRQAGNGELPVPSGKVGVYKVNGEKEIKGYTITQVFEQYPFPEFIAESGYIYNFEFDGDSVKTKEKQNMIFGKKL
jgi:hypothetical protein